MSTIAVDENGDLARGVVVLKGREAVGQNVKQRLLLLRGEWFLDITAGVPYYESVLGRFNPEHTALLFREEILKVQDVTGATVEVELRPGRILHVSAVVYTNFGEINIGDVDIKPVPRDEAPLPPPEASGLAPGPGPGP